MSETKRDRCAECLGQYQLKTDGTIRHHLGDIWRGGWRQVCKGAGKPPAVMQTPVAVEIVRDMAARGEL